MIPRKSFLKRWINGDAAEARENQQGERLEDQRGFVISERRAAYEEERKNAEGLQKSHRTLGERHHTAWELKITRSQENGRIIASAISKRTFF